MRDPRIDEYARLLIERSVPTRPGAQIVIRSTPLARPLIEAVVEQVARKGGHTLLQLAFELVGGPFARNAPVELLREASSLQRTIWDQADGFVIIWAPENAREGSDLSEERQAAVQESLRPLRTRTMAMEVPWVIAEYPTAAGAQDAGMTIGQYEEFIFEAVLRDWDAEGERMRRIADVFDDADEVQISGAGTELTVSVAGRSGSVDAGHVNMPGGEVFYSPIEDSASGTIEFSEFPAVYLGTEVEGVRLVFDHGKVVEATARSGEEHLVRVLDTDEGSRRLGELGIGCNPGIQRYMKNVAFDEKIDGTVHLAVGNSYTFTGGTNASVIHWDLV